MNKKTISLTMMKETWATMLVVGEVLNMTPQELIRKEYSHELDPLKVKDALDFVRAVPIELVLEHAKGKADSARSSRTKKSKAASNGGYVPQPGQMTVQDLITKKRAKESASGITRL